MPSGASALRSGFVPRAEEDAISCPSGQGCLNPSGGGVSREKQVPIAKPLWFILKWFEMVAAIYGPGEGRASGKRVSWEEAGLEETALEETVWEETILEGGLLKQTAETEKGRDPSYARAKQ